MNWFFDTFLGKLISIIIIIAIGYVAIWNWERVMNIAIKINKNSR